MRIDVGAILNLLFRQRNIQTLGLPVWYAQDGDWRNQHLPAAKPAASVYREITYGPGLILEIKLIYRPNLAVRGPNGKPSKIFAFFQNGCSPGFPPLGGSFSGGPP